MEKFNPKVNEYIANSADFAKPILEHLRQLIHDTCPLAEEKIKWGMPFFDYNGEMLCNMASFKHHCAFGFWKAKLMKDASILAVAQSEQAMGHLGKITALSDLPPDEKLIEYIIEAMVLNEKGIKIKKTKPEKSVEMDLPSDFKEKLAANSTAIEYFESKSASFRKEYIVWIIEAKSETTRKARIDQAVEWIAEGKSRLWKYETPKSKSL
jgi:uncharacterized protein YdeI (YjbR/CyaY-like superfamily)